MKSTFLMTAQETEEELKSREIVSSTNCECCGNRPIAQVAKEHGYNLCEMCSRGASCSECEDTPAYITEDSPFIWESWTCEKCQSANEMYAWLDETESAVALAAKSAGFSIDVNGSNLSEARYLTISDADEFSMVVRIADHEVKTYHDEPDYSIEREGTESACSLETVLKAIESAKQR